LSRQLYGLIGTSPAALAALAALLAVMSLAATLVPARRAASVDPAHALRAL
jgi:ABC-type lipoprotein release transport system permease subunit